MLSKLVYAYSPYYVTAPSSVNFHSHPIYECIYYAQGAGCIHTESNKYSYSQGTFVVIRPNVTHNEIHYMPTMPVCFGYIALATEAEFDDEITVFTVNTGTNIPTYLQMIMDEQANNKSNRDELCELLCDMILILLRRLQQGVVSATPIDFTSPNAKHSWDPTGDSDITAIWNAYLQEYKHYSYDRFRHVFKSRMGISPAKFLSELRNQKAKYLLTTTAMNITDIAMSCGYTSCSYFSQQFLKLNGVSPSRFRLKLGNSPASLINWFTNDKAVE